MFPGHPRQQRKYLGDTVHSCIGKWRQKKKNTFFHNLKTEVENDAVAKKTVSCVTSLMLHTDRCAERRVMEHRKEELCSMLVPTVGTCSCSLVRTWMRNCHPDPSSLRICLLTTSERDCHEGQAPTLILPNKEGPSSTALPSSNTPRVTLSHFTPNNPINSVRGKPVYRMDKGSTAAYSASVWLNSGSSPSQHDFFLIHSLTTLLTIRFASRTISPNYLVKTDTFTDTR